MTKWQSKNRILEKRKKLKYHIGGDWSGLRESWTEQSTEKSFMKTWSRVLRASDWAKGSLRQHRSGLGTTVNVLKWPSQSPDLNPISGETWECLSTNSPHPTWQRLRGSAEQNGRKSPNNNNNNNKCICPFGKIDFFNCYFPIYTHTSTQGCNITKCEKMKGSEYFLNALNMSCF